ncbi:MAG: DUF3149 domain-containing protein [Gammaproteobacteria bacterium SHHR-1]|nr:DUF3149 domain-containing protein [gamma proteobacterium SS-5]
MDALEIELYASLAIIGATLVIGLVYVVYFINKIRNAKEDE